MNIYVIIFRQVTHVFYVLAFFSIGVNHLNAQQIIWQQNHPIYNDYSAVLIDSTKTIMAFLGNHDATSFQYELRVFDSSGIMIDSASLLNSDFVNFETIDVLEFEEYGSYVALGVTYDTSARSNERYFIACFDSNWNKSWLYLSDNTISRISKFRDNSIIFLEEDDWPGYFSYGFTRIGIDGTIIFQKDTIKGYNTQCYDRSLFWGFFEPESGIIKDGYNGGFTVFCDFRIVNVDEDLNYISHILPLYAGAGATPHWELGFSVLPNGNYSFRSVSGEPGAHGFSGGYGWYNEFDRSGNLLKSKFLYAMTQRINSAPIILDDGTYLFSLYGGYNPANSWKSIIDIVTDFNLPRDSVIVLGGMPHMGGPYWPNPNPFTFNDWAFKDGLLVVAGKKNSKATLIAIDGFPNEMELDPCKISKPDANFRFTYHQSDLTLINTSSDGLPYGNLDSDVEWVTSYGVSGNDDSLTFNFDTSLTKSLAVRMIVTNYYGCKDTLDKIIQVNTIADGHSDSELRIYPNPATNRLRVESNILESIQFYDLAMNRINVVSYKLQNGIDFSLDIEPGWYLLEITMENGLIEYRKLMIQ